MRRAYRDMLIGAAWTVVAALVLGWLGSLVWMLGKAAGWWR